jgi:hypothetical protein
MRTQQQINNIKNSFSDPYLVDDFITQDEIRHLIDLFENDESETDPLQAKVYKNTGPITLNIYKFLGDTVIDNILEKLKSMIGPFDITAGFFFFTNYPHIIHNDDLFELPETMYKGITIPLRLDSDSAVNLLPDLCFFDQCYFHGPSKFFNGDSDIPTFYNKQIYEYSLVDGVLDHDIITADTYEKYFTHLKKKWLSGLSFKSSLPWKPGSCIIFDSVRLHCASDFRKLGYKSKLGISIFTKRIC